MKYTSENCFLRSTVVLQISEHDTCLNLMYSEDGLHVTSFVFRIPEFFFVLMKIIYPI